MQAQVQHIIPTFSFMTKAGGHKAGKTYSTKSQQWAAQVLSISENTRQGGIEIRFDAEPSPSLQPKLRVMGFRHSRTKSMWYSDKTDQARQFAEQVKKTLPVNADGPSLQLSPSADAVKANLEKKAFSYVMYTLKNGQTKSYVLFEPSKPRAEVIAANFAGEEFGDELLAFAVLPRTHMKEARILFDEGKIIYPAGPPDQTAANTNKTNAMSNTGLHQNPPGAKVPVQTILLTTEAVSRDPDFSAGVKLHTWKEANVYVKSKIGKHISDVYYKVQWKNGDHFGGMVDLEPSEFFDHIDNPLSNHITTYLTNYSKTNEQDPFYDKEYVNYARHLLSNCLFEDPAETSAQVAAEAEDGKASETLAGKQPGQEREALDKFYKWAVRQEDLSMKPAEVTLERMTKWFRENLPELSSETISTIWESHQRILKSLEIKIRKRNPRAPFDSIYKKILKVIPGLIGHIKAGKTTGKSKVDPDGGLMALNYKFRYYDKNGYPIIALSHYFRQNGDPIADPDMEIRLMPDLEVAEALTYQDQFRYQEVYREEEGRQYVFPKLKKDLNKFLNQWLTNIIHQGHRIDLSTENEGMNGDQEKELWDLIHKLLPDLKLEGEQQSKISISDEQRHLIQISLGPRGYIGNFNLDLKEIAEGIDQFRASVLLKPGEKGAETYSLFMSRNPAPHSILKTGPETMPGDPTDDPEELNAGLISWLRQLVGRGVRLSLEGVREEKAILEPEPKKQSLTLLSGTPVFNAQVMARLIHTQTYLLNAWGLSHPKNVIQQKTFSSEDITQLRAFFAIYVMEDRPMQANYLDLYREQCTEAVDLTFQETGTPLPNVLVPAGTREPFHSHNWRAYDMRSLLQNSFASLIALTNEKLNQASPLQLYELAQLGNPSSYRIAVSQEKLINIWRTRGRELFDELGLPTNLQYPYSDLIAGYENMRSLRDLLNDGDAAGNEWWIAAALYRPVADLGKAKVILDEMLSNKMREKQSYLRADGQRPRPNYKHHVEQIDRTIQYLEESRGVLQAYFLQDGNVQKEQTITVRKAQPAQLDAEEQNTGETNPSGIFSDALTNDSGVYTRETAGDNLEEIAIPMPKTAQYTAEIRIAKTSAGTYKKGISATKNFGDYEGFGTAPSVFDRDFQSRNEALRAALLEHEERLERLLASKDSILNNEEKKNRQLSMALKAVIDFARNNGIELDETLPKEKEHTNQGTDQTGNVGENAKNVIDPLADEDGIYNQFSAGENFETLIVPMPKSAGYYAEVFLVKTSAGNYRQGILHTKQFGDVSYSASFPETRAEAYSSRKAALKAALLHHEQDLEIQLGRKDTILNNEASQHKRLTLAMKALYQFAEENRISMKAVPEKDEGIIPGLEAAYWMQHDSADEANKIIVKAQAFHQARLRELIGTKLEALPISTLEEIRTELAARFRERRPFSSYEQGLLTVGKKGNDRKASLIAAYIDDIIIDNDLKDKDHAPVMSLLLDMLFSGLTRLVDTPQESQSPAKKSKPIKKQSQLERNKEIEAFIDEKDRAGAYYDEQEKNYLRQYSGSGGLLGQGATGRGTLYEFYTPDGIVKKMWDIAYHYGYDGGSILEPAVGTGNFLKYAPKHAEVFAFETNHYACRVGQILYPNAHIQEKAFETHFFAGNIHLKDKFENPGYSLAIGNPPYGTFNGKYAGLGEKRHTGVTEYDQYFTLRSLDLLKPGGLLVFLIPSSFMLSTQKYNKTKEKISARAEWVDAYRFPEDAFPNTSIGTDILVLRKRQ